MSRTVLICDQMTYLIHSQENRRIFFHLLSIEQIYSEVTTESTKIVRYLGHILNYSESQDFQDIQPQTYRPL